MKPVRIFQSNAQEQFVKDPKVDAFAKIACKAIRRLVAKADKAGFSLRDTAYLLNASVSTEVSLAILGRFTKRPRRK